MAFADYFAKNAQSAGALISGMQPDAFKAVLETEVIGIAADGNAATTVEGRATLDLVVRLVCRLYPAIAFLDLDGKAKTAISRARLLALQVNPKIDIIERTPTKYIVIGKTALKTKSGAFVAYTGSQNWLALLSMKQPAGSGRSRNPFGAGAAACFAVANLFRATFAEQLGSPATDAALRFSMLELKIVDTKAKNPKLKKFDLGDLYLVGLGAIGNGFLWAFSRLVCAGEINLVDGDTLELGNLQRYAMTILQDVGKPKAELSAEWIKGCGAKAVPHNQHWETYVASRLERKFEHVAVAVDTEKTRFYVQSSLPKILFNSWTGSGEFGISWHHFLGDGACLACLYLPTQKAPNFDEILARALHLPEDPAVLQDIRRRLELGQPTERAFLERVSQASGVALEELLPFENVSLREFYVRAICGGAVLSFGSEALKAQADVPMAFQSTLAGIFLAADVVAYLTRLRSRQGTITQMDLLRPVQPFLQRSRAKHPRCLCADADFRAAYAAKYGELAP